jgi:hypothetical protein
MIHVPSLFLAKHFPVTALAERTDRCKAEPLDRGCAFSPRESERRGWFCPRSVVLIFAGFRTLRFVRARGAKLVGARGRTARLRAKRLGFECAAMKSPTIFDQASITSVSRVRSRGPAEGDFSKTLRWL